MTGDRLTALAQLAYAAALDERLWSDWSEQMRRHFGAAGVVFGLVDQHAGAMKSGLFLFPDRDLSDFYPDYVEQMGAQDPVLRRLMSGRNSEIFGDRDAVDPDNPRDRDYLAWQLARIGIRHNCTAAAGLGGGLRAGIALNLTPRAGPLGAEKRRELEALFPHFSQAMALGFRHNALLQEQWWEGLRTGRESAAILLGENGTVLRMTPLAEAVVRAADALSVRADRLSAVVCGSDGPLQAVLAAALAPIAPEAGAARVERCSGRQPVLLAVHPLPRSRRFLAPDEAAAVVRIVDPAAARPGLCRLQRDLFGLSAREAEVAGLLLAGHSLESVSTSLDIRLNTVRNHLQSLFRKTGCNRQSDLVRLLLASGRELN